MKILHIIPSLENGGAEGVLARICVNDKKNNHIILCLSSYGFYSDYLEKNKIPIKIKFKIIGAAEAAANLL